METKLKKIPIFIILSFVLIALIIFGIIYFVGPNEEEIYYKNIGNEELTRICEIMTNDDKLADSEKNIIEFSNQLNSAKQNANIDELNKVIPTDCIKPHENQQPFYYIGKEYGFLVVPNKYSEYHIFIFDLTWNNDGLEQKARIDVLSSVNVRFSNDNEKDAWKRIADDNKNYYLKNISFGAILINENESNYGDNSYSKYSDNGLIIQSAVIKYGGDNIVKGDGKTELNSFAVEHVLGSTSIDNYDKLTSKFNFVDATEPYQNTTEMIDCDHERSVIAKSRYDQYSKKDFKTFTRVGYVTPSQNDGDIFLGHGGYAEYSVLLSDTALTSRIFQQISFDIVSIDRGGNIKSYGENQILYAIRERTIFEENCYASSDYYSEDYNIPVNVLPRGRQLIKIRPEYDGIYTFTLRDEYKNDFLKVDMGVYDPYNQLATSKDNAVYTAELIAHKEYTWVIEQNSSEPYNNKRAIYTFTPNLLKVNEQEQFEISNGNTHSFSILNDTTVIYKITADIPQDVKMNVRSKLGNTLFNKDSGTYEFICEKDVRYFVTFINKYKGDVQCGVMLSEGDSIGINDEKDIALKPNEVKYLSFIAPVEGYYDISSDNNCEVFLLNDKLNGLPSSDSISVVFKQNETVILGINNKGNKIERSNLKISLRVRKVNLDSNECSDEWVMFMPLSAQNYNFSIEDGEISIYDSHLEQIALVTDNINLYLEEENVVYIHFNGNGRLKISVNSTPLPELIMVV